MKTFYRSHEIVVNTEPNGQILYDIFNRHREHLLSGFSQQNIGETAVLDLAKARVDQFWLEPPVTFRFNRA